MLDYWKIKLVCSVDRADSQRHSLTLVWFHGDLNGLDLCKLYYYLSMNKLNWSISVQMF